MERTGINEDITTWVYCSACKRAIPAGGRHERTIDRQLNALYEFRKELLIKKIRNDAGLGLIF